MKSLIDKLEREFIRTLVLLRYKKRIHNHRKDTRRMILNNPEIIDLKYYSNNDY